MGDFDWDGEIEVYEVFFYLRVARAKAPRPLHNLPTLVLWVVCVGHPTGIPDHYL